MKQYDGFHSQDSLAEGGWVRIFCAPMPEGACGLMVFQQHYSPVNDFFDAATEANIGIVTGGSVEHAMELIKQGRGHVSPIPSAIRRLARLLSHGDLSTQIGNTVSERGLERAVAYSPENSEKRLAMFDRAGWRKEDRAGQVVYVLDI